MTALALDMFTDIIAVHWSNKGFTKLDFVNDRYMVAGKDQDLEDVLGNDVDDNRATSAEQLSWRSSVGLDLLGRDSDDGVTVDLAAGPRRAYLKNKIDVPTKKDPGALNEFLFFNYTLVAEFDRYNFDLAWQQINGRGIDAFWEILGFSDNENEQYWSFANAEERITSPTGLPEKNEDLIIPFIQIYSPPRDDGLLLWWDGSAGGTTDPATGQVGYVDPVTGDTWGHIYALTQPPSHVVHIHADAIPDTDFFKAVSDLAVFDYSSDYPINGRIIGATPDLAFNSAAPMTNGALPVPWGRVRVAMNITNEKVVFSFNGSDPVSVTAPPFFAMPRLPPLNEAGTSRLNYFPIEAAGPVMNLEYYMNFPGIMRCIWLFRRPKADEKLKDMSVVQPLPAANSSRWTRPPGQDQEP